MRSDPGDPASKILNGAIPSGTKLNGANLNGVSHLDRKLSFADLTGADLRYAGLRRANLDGANWRRAIIVFWRAILIPGGGRRTIFDGVS